LAASYYPLKLHGTEHYLQSLYLVGQKILYDYGCKNSLWGSEKPTIESQAKQSLSTISPKIQGLFLWLS
jgi:hypothetical protein